MKEKACLLDCSACHPPCLLYWLQRKEDRLIPMTQLDRCQRRNLWLSRRTSNNRNFPSGWVEKRCKNNNNNNFKGFLYSWSGHFKQLEKKKGILEVNFVSFLGDTTWLFSKLVNEGKSLSAGLFSLPSSLPTVLVAA
jgi:hypothetical protein